MLVTALTWPACLLSVPPLLDDTAPPDDCTPGQAVVCYDGPEGTDGVGLCVSGQGVCGEDGSIESCVGQVLPVGELCDSDDAADEDCNGAVNDHCALWSASFGDSGGDRVQGLLATDDEVVLSGNFAARIDFGGPELTTSTGLSGYVAALDHDGAHLWTAGLDGNSSETVRDMAAAGGVVYAGGSFSGSLAVESQEVFSGSESSNDCFVLALGQADGALDWIASFGDTANCAISGVAAHDGGVIVGGSFDGDVTFPMTGTLSANGGDDVVLGSFDDSGMPRWALTAGGTGDDEILALAVEGDALYVSGIASGAFDLGCAGAEDADDDGDGFVARLDAADGSCDWVLPFAGAGRIRARALDARDGRVFVGLDFETAVSLPGGASLTSAGELDIAVVALTNGGAPLWSRQFGDEGKQEMFTASAPADGGVLIGGSTNGSPDFGEGPITTADAGDDAYVIRFDADGEVLWSRSFGGDGDDDTIAADYAATGALFIGGEVFISMDLGQGPISGDNIDAFVARLDP
jgi:hypothetical protein